MSSINCGPRHIDHRDQNFSKLSPEEQENVINESRQSEKQANQYKGLTLTVRPSRFRLPFRSTANVTVVLENRNSCAISFTVDTNSPMTLTIDPESGCLYSGEREHIIVGRPNDTDKLPRTRTKEYLIFNIRCCKYCTHKESSYKSPKRYKDKAESNRRGSRNGLNQVQPRESTKQLSPQQERIFDDQDIYTPKHRYPSQSRHDGFSRQPSVIKKVDDKIYVITNDLSGEKDPEDAYRGRNSHKTRPRHFKGFEPSPRSHVRKTTDDTDMIPEDFMEPDHTRKRTKVRKKSKAAKGSQKGAHPYFNHGIPQYGYNYEPSYQHDEDPEYPQQTIPKTMSVTPTSEDEPSIISDIKRQISNALAPLKKLVNGRKDRFRKGTDSGSHGEKCSCLNCRKGGNMDKHPLDHVRHSGQQQEYYLAPDGRMHVIEEDSRSTALHWLPHILLLFVVGIAVTFVFVYSQTAYIPFMQQPEQSFLEKYSPF